jgi:hypothetical protein
MLTATLALAFALTPCCDPASAADAHAGSADAHDGAHDGAHAPDGADPCAQWLDRSDALANKADNLVSFDGDATLGVPYLPVPLAVPAGALGARLARLPIPPPAALYLRHARLIL